MLNHIAKCELTRAQVASMDALIDGGLLVTLFFTRFGDRTMPPSGAAISVLLTEEDFT